MSFASPWFFYLAGLLPVIVVMYLLKLRRLERPVSSTYLWRQMVQDVEANAPWQRLRRNLLMMLQLLFLALLILALVRPQTQAPGLSADTAIFIFDTSASMAATDVEPTRLEAAKTRARQLLDNLPAESRVTIIDAGVEARILASESTDRRQVLQAIEGMQPNPGGSDLGVALQLASAVARRRPGCHTIVISDGNATLPQRLSIQGKLTYEQIGLENSNQAIGLLNLQLTGRNTTGNTSLTAFTQVVNYGDQPVHRRLAVSADGLLVNVFDLELPAGGEQPMLAEGLPSNAAVIEARLLPPGDPTAAQTGQANENHQAAGNDFLAWDDVMMAVNRPTQLISTTLVSAGNRFLETGLSLLPGLRLTRINPGVGAFPSAELTIFDSYTPITATLPGSALLFIGPVRSTEFFMITGVVQSPSFHPASDSEALLENISLDDIHILDSARIPLPAWARPVILADDPSGGKPIPLMFVGEVDGRRVAVLTFDLRHSDLPLTIAFPLLLANLTYWLAPSQGTLPVDVAPGEAITLALPPEAVLAGQTTATITSPSGTRTTLDLASGPAIFADTFDLGIYQVNAGGQVTRFAVNLVSPQESYLEPAKNLPVAGIDAATVAAVGETTEKDWWRLLAALALGMLTAEWLVYHRATIRMLTDSLFRRFKST